MMPRAHKLENVSYHTGLLNVYPSTRWFSEGFHRMIQNMELGGVLDGDTGYGILGTGVYHTTDHDDLQLDQKDHPYAYVIDCSNEHYHCFVPQDENAALWFLSHYQTWVIQQAIHPEGWENLLPGVTTQDLYNEYVKTFEGYPLLSRNKFDWLTQEIIDYTASGFMQGLDEAGYPRVDPELYHADNVSTLFLKDQGFGGVDLRGSQWDNVEHGSVIFNLQPEDVFARFATTQQLDEFENRFLYMANLADAMSEAGFLCEGIVNAQTLRIGPLKQFSDCQYFVDLTIVQNEAEIQTIWINNREYNFTKDADYLKRNYDKLYAAVQTIDQIAHGQEFSSLTINEYLRGDD